MALLDPSLATDLSPQVLKSTAENSAKEGKVCHQTGDEALSWQRTGMKVRTQEASETEHSLLGLPMMLCAVPLALVSPAILPRYTF